MTMETTIQFNDNEKLACVRAYNVLGELVDKVGKRTELVNTISGEVIDTEELGRVLGILDGIANNDSEWEVHTRH